MMSIWQQIISDPIVWGSLLGISVVVGICSYYVWYFLSHIAAAPE